MNTIVINPVSLQEDRLVKELLDKMKISYKSENGDSLENENSEWYQYSQKNLAEAYSYNEPEYTIQMVKEPNPEYIKNHE